MFYASVIYAWAVLIAKVVTEVISFVTIMTIATTQNGKTEQLYLLTVHNAAAPETGAESLYVVEVLLGPVDIQDSHRV